MQLKLNFRLFQIYQVSWKYSHFQLLQDYCSNIFKNLFFLQKVLYLYQLYVSYRELYMDAQNFRFISSVEQDI